jgi:hypothetical protein
MDFRTMGYNHFATGARINHVIDSKVVESHGSKIHQRVTFLCHGCRRKRRRRRRRRRSVYSQQETDRYWVPVDLGTWTCEEIFKGSYRYYICESQ